MGATTSSSSPACRPAKCSLWETRATTRLFKVPDYSKWVLMPAGSAVLFDDTLHLHDIGYDLKVYPAGFDREAADFVALSVKRTFGHYSSQFTDSPRISIEILDGGGNHTVFDNHTAKSEQKLFDSDRSWGYVRFVKRRELEASGCVRDDSITIRCTVSVDQQVTRSAAEVMEALTAAASDPSKTKLSGSHTLTINQFKRIKAGLGAGECVHSTQFNLGGSSWYFKVYPNGHYDGTKCLGNMSIFLARGRSGELATTAEFGFELPGTRATRSTEHIFDNDHPEHEFRYFPLLFEEKIQDDRLVVRCHLRVIKATLPPILLTTEDPPTATVPPSDVMDQDSLIL